MELDNPEYYNDLGEKNLKVGDLRSAYKNFSWAVMLGGVDGPERYNPTNKKNKINCKHLFNKAFVLNKFQFNLESKILSTALETIEIVLNNNPSYPGAKDLKEELIKEHTRTEVFSDGVKIIYPFINAKLNGTSTEKNQDDVILREKTFKNDILEGPYKYYHSNGQLLAEMHFKNGEQADGIVDRYDESGNLIKKSTIKNGDFNGIQTFFYENGKIKSEIMMVDGEELGQFKEYDIQGRLVKDGENKKDKLIEDYNLEELINLLKNNPEFKIEAMIYEEQRGAFQVKNEKEYEEFYTNLSWNDNKTSPPTLIDSKNEIYNEVFDNEGEIITIEYDEYGDEIIELNTDHCDYEDNKNNINLSKKIYSTEYCNWIKFDIDIKWLIENIKDYEKEDRLEKTIEDLKHEAWSDYTPPEAIVDETLSGSIIDSGLGTSEGRNDISWSCVIEYRNSHIDLKLI